MDIEAFVTAFGGIYEATPSIARAAHATGPFADRDAVLDAFAAAAAALDDDAVLALLRAHPQLGARGAMAAASTSEQAGAGLRTISDEQRGELDANNAAYLARFGFPFIMAVRGLDRTEIGGRLRRRLGNDPVEELATAFAEVQKIARLRLESEISL